MSADDAVPMPDRPPRLGSIGVWNLRIHRGDPGEARDAAAELDELGYGTIWLGGSPDPTLGTASALLNATSRITVATGIVSIWDTTAAEVAKAYAAVSEEYPGRFLLGLGVSHAVAVERTGRPYTGVYAKLAGYLDELDAAPRPVPRAARVIGAMGPRMTALARDRTVGTHPYLGTPEHTRQMREILGKGPLLAPELKVILETDPDKARAVARQMVSMYLTLPNYTNAWMRVGFTADDLADGGSDRLIDALFAWGDEDTVISRVREHHEAGADHVCLQVIAGHRDVLPRVEWRLLADVLQLSR